MKDEDKTRDQLMNELVHARRRVSELERLEGLHQRAEEELRSRSRQRAAAAKLGQWALGEDDLSALMDGTVVLVSRTLEVEYAKVLELLPEGDALLLRAGVGWKEGLVGEATVDAGTDSQAGYALLRSEPVVVEDLRSETRFRGPPLLTEHGVVSGISVVIRGQEGRPYGVLGTHTAERRAFTENDVNFLRMVSNVLAAAVRRKQAEEEIQRSEERFRRLVEGLKDYAILSIDPDGRIVGWNAGAESIFGYGEAEISGRAFNFIFTPEDCRRGVPEQELRKAASEGRAEDERWHVRKDGTRFYASGVVTPLIDENGEPRGFLKAARDITERVRTQEAMREIREAERRRIARDLHDAVLQDLVSALQAMQLARARSEGSAMDGNLERVIGALRRGTEGLRGAIYDLRLEKEQPFVKGVEALMVFNRQMSPEREVRLDVGEDFPEDLPRKVRVELLRVVQEALTNVRRHSGARRAEVRLRAGGNRVWVEVVDDGRGFDRGGVPEGVGLSGMRERVAALGGKLEIETEAGKGTTVVVSVPFPASDTPDR